MRANWRKKRIASYKIYWYKLIPFIIAEILNPEWDKLEPMIKEGKLTTLTEMYNKNGNWYILEGLDYFYLGRHIYTEDGFLFGDSMHFRHIKLSDKKKYQSLVDEAKENIDEFWKNLFTFKNKK